VWSGGANEIGLICKNKRNVEQSDSEGVGRDGASSGVGDGAAGGDGWVWVVG
jgi:hypothetical protein